MELTKDARDSNDWMDWLHGFDWLRLIHSGFLYKDAVDHGIQVAAPVSAALDNELTST